MKSRKRKEARCPVQLIRQALQSGLSGRAAKVYLALRVEADEQDRIDRCGKDRIAGLTGLSLRSVYYAICELERLGLIETTSSSGRGKVGSYSLLSECRIEKVRDNESPNKAEKGLNTATCCSISPGNTATCCSISPGNTATCCSISGEKPKENGQIRVCNGENRGAKQPGNTATCCSISGENPEENGRIRVPEVVGEILQPVAVFPENGCSIPAEPAENDGSNTDILSSLFTNIESTPSLSCMSSSLQFETSKRKHIETPFVLSRRIDENENAPSETPPKKKKTNRVPDSIAWKQSTGWVGITDLDRQCWATAYPACNLDAQLARMDQWLRANPERSHKKAWRRFIINWLSRSQDRGGDLNLPARPAGRTSPRDVEIDPSIFED